MSLPMLIHYLSGMEQVGSLSFSQGLCGRWIPDVK